MNTRVKPAHDEERLVAIQPALPGRRGRVGPSRCPITHRRHRRAWPGDPRGGAARQTLC